MKEAQAFARAIAFAKSSPLSVLGLTNARNRKHQKGVGGRLAVARFIGQSPTAVQIRRQANVAKDLPVWLSRVVIRHPANGLSKS
jgi:hypothetical protein